MLDVKFIRDNKAVVKGNILHRGADPKKADVEAILNYDNQRKTVQKELEALNTERKNAADARLFEKGRELKDKAKTLGTKVAALERLINDRLQWVPNMLSKDTPDGKSEADNVEVKVWLPSKGYLPKSKLGKGSNAAQYMPKKTGKDHVALGKDLDLIDLEQSAKVSGSRFSYLRGDAVLIQYALFDLLFKKLLKEDFIPFMPPLLVREKALFGTSHFPEGKDQIYKIENFNVEEKEGLYLVGSSEPALFAYCMDKKFKEEDLPFKMMAQTTCFRSEVGSWGKDVRGIKRVHQFDKLEMDVVCAPKQSEKVFADLLSVNEWLLQKLKLPYRIIQKCAKEAGYYATYKQYDVEVWRPTVGEFMEFGTCTNATDYQARRLNIRVQCKDGSKVFAHTINDTGVTPRTLIAILENYQQEDGLVKVPPVLQKYVGSKIIITQTQKHVSSP